MAIPENHIDKFTKGNDIRYICPAADKVVVDNDNFEGTDLDAVLDEVAEGLENAGTGNVSSVTMNGTTISPDANGNVALGTVITQHQDISGKQDVISDLATIRTGAAAGATAVQLGSLATVATSGSYDDLSDKPTIPAAVTVDQTVVEDSANAVAGGAVYDELATKQDTLTFDDVPTDGSDNPVKSNGIYDAIADKLTNVTVNAIPAGSVAIVDDLTTGGSANALSAEQGKVLNNKISLINQRIALIRTILENATFTTDQSANFAALAALDNAVFSLTLSSQTLTFSGVSSQTLTATTDPVGATVAWTSSDDEIATVAGGVVTSVGNGSCTITASAGGLTATCAVTVSGVVAPTYINFNGDTVSESLVLANYSHSDPSRISTDEAAAVTSLFVNSVSPFKQSAITDASWLQYFTNIYTTEDTSGTTTGFGAEFYKCTSLTKIIVPEGITRIKSDSMYLNTACTFIDLPSTLTNIFIRGIYCDGTIIVRANSVTLQTSGSIKGTPTAIYVPDAYVDTYKAANLWSNYSSIIHPLSDYNG